MFFFVVGGGGEDSDGILFEISVVVWTGPYPGGVSTRAVLYKYGDKRARVVVVVRTVIEHSAACCSPAFGIAPFCSTLNSKPYYPYPLLEKARRVVKLARRGRGSVGG